MSYMVFLPWLLGCELTVGFSQLGPSTLMPKSKLPEAVWDRLPVGFLTDPSIGRSLEQKLKLWTACFNVGDLSKWATSRTQKRVLGTKDVGVGTMRYLGLFNTLGHQPSPPQTVPPRLTLASLEVVFRFRRSSSSLSKALMAWDLSHSCWPIFAAVSTGGNPPSASGLLKRFVLHREENWKFALEICLPVLRVRLRH